jgi:uncharacterized membrane protein HdeD (DUF308 family)
MRAYKSLVVVMAVLMMLLGFALVVRTLMHGFGVGVLLGALFIAAGAGRLALMRRGR